MTKKKVVVGISGGIDSAISAYLLKQQGYEVIGVFMRNWDALANAEFNSKEATCPQEIDYQDAIITCQELGIKLIRKDFIKEYWDDVFQMFLSDYKQNRTPNPDIFCNKYIKFTAFLNYAKTQLQTDYIAMGHYAQVNIDQKNNEYQLLKGKDLAKDQSYFLAQLTQAQLRYTIFPLGTYQKTTVRALAQQLNLTIAAKKDSTGICFIGNRNLKTFLTNYIPANPGVIIDINTKKIVGNHEGTYYYTIGQRKGLNLGGYQTPYFVVKKDVINNILYVANDNENKWLMQQYCDVVQVNWISKVIPTTSLFCYAKFRYRQPDVPVTITFISNEAIKVKCQYPVRAMTTGQAAVFYQGDICLGSGIINAVY